MDKNIYSVKKPFFKLYKHNRQGGEAVKREDNTVDEIRVEDGKVKSKNISSVFYNRNIDSVLGGEEIGNKEGSGGGQVRLGLSRSEIEVLARSKLREKSDGFIGENGNKEVEGKKKIKVEGNIKPFRRNSRSQNDIKFYMHERSSGTNDLSNANMLKRDDKVNDRRDSRLGSSLPRLKSHNNSISKENTLTSFSQFAEKKGRDYHKGLDALWANVGLYTGGHVERTLHDRMVKSKNPNEEGKMLVNVGSENGSLSKTESKPLLLHNKNTKSSKILEDRIKENKKDQLKTNQRRGSDVTRQLQMVEDKLIHGLERTSYKSQQGTVGRQNPLGRMNSFLNFYRPQESHEDPNSSLNQDAESPEVSLDRKIYSKRNLAPSEAKNNGSESRNDGQAHATPFLSKLADRQDKLFQFRPSVKRFESPSLRKEEGLSGDNEKIKPGHKGKGGIKTRASPVGRNLTREQLWTVQSTLLASTIQIPSLEMTESTLYQLCIRVSRLINNAYSQGTPYDKIKGIFYELEGNQGSELIKIFKYYDKGWKYDEFELYRICRKGWIRPKRLGYSMDVDIRWNDPILHIDNPRAFIAKLNNFSNKLAKLALEQKKESIESLQEQFKEKVVARLKEQKIKLLDNPEALEKLKLLSPASSAIDLAGLIDSFSPMHKKNRSVTTLVNQSLENGKEVSLQFINSDAMDQNKLVHDICDTLIV